MNDDFLHRIRVEPPAGFLASLKARLDRQLPPPPVTSPRRSLIRVLVFGLLFGGSVFAISLLTVNGLPDFARNLVQMRHQSPQGQVTTTRRADTPPRFPWGSDSTPAGQAPAEEPGHAGQTFNPPRDTRATGSANNTAPTVQSTAPGAYTRPPEVITLVAAKPLEADIKLRTADFSQLSRPFRADVAVTAADTATEALAQFCTKGTPGKSKSSSDIAVVARRITRAEYEVCIRNLGSIAEVQMERQAIVLARSKLYGTLALSASDIFLALAAEIPDPDHPGGLIGNPNTMWDQVNGSLDNAPIEVFGPPAQSATGVAFRQVLLAAGCNSLPAITALKQTDSARYERVCTTLRKDRPYVEVPEELTFDALQRLQTHPNAIGVLGYRQWRVFGSNSSNESVLVTNPIGGVEPTPEAISSGTYPGSRTLYVYLNQWRAPAEAPYLIAWLAQSRAGVGNFIAVPLDDAQLKMWRIYPLNLPDLKM